ncbi:MAG: hypothetical protein CVU39_02995 [Chloroflexi bacterium HGW-Chloroflexi-10]|nr:MAG: hypothetical protein CVU39_02995 [Chloroflexi bacterium HGW-Chloroflexi-10]
MQEPKLLYQATGYLDAKTIQLMLESFGVESQVIQESAGVAMGLNLGRLGSANVYVEAADLDEANRIIALMENGELEIPVSLESDLEPEDELVDSEVDSEDSEIDTD